MPVRGTGRRARGKGQNTGGEGAKASERERRGETKGDDVTDEARRRRSTGSRMKRGS